MPDMDERRKVAGHALENKQKRRIAVVVQRQDTSAILNAMLKRATFPGLRHERPHLKFVEAQNPSRQKPR